MPEKKAIPLGLFNFNYDSTNNPYAQTKPQFFF